MTRAKLSRIFSRFRESVCNFILHDKLVHQNTARHLVVVVVVGRRLRDTLTRLIRRIRGQIAHAANLFLRRYGLLGASGCGKTTLLSCIVGRRRLNSGEIWVLGGKPGTKGSGVPGKQVGYMPQEIALYGEFTIRETMMYFGWIFGMGTAEIVERLRFLLQFLDLPSQNRLVKNLRYARAPFGPSPDRSVRVRANGAYYRFRKPLQISYCCPGSEPRINSGRTNGAR